ncbi:MAG: site-specific integrase [Clostridia bacterium]|nr:site-specific integrase [Clostridia bacterium]
MAKKTNSKINGKEYYRIRKVIGHKSDGKKILKNFYGESKKEAEQKATEYLNNIQNGLVINFDNFTISDLMQSWLFDFLHNSSKIKPSTFQRYEGLYRNYIKDSQISGSKLINIKSIQLQKFYNSLYDKGYSYSQINTLNTFLKVFFNWCIDNDYILKNPCSKVNIKGNKTEIINNERKEVEILSEEEIKIIKDYLKGSNFELLFLLDLASGLRQGELLALDWDHIDLKNKIIKIEKSVKEVYIYEDETHKHIESIFQTPKTLNSFRDVPLPDVIIGMLNKIALKKGLLFKDIEGKPLKGKNVSTEWSKILKKCNITHKKFHSIRHTYASILLQKGVDIETVAELMGHSAISITQIYLHSSQKSKSKSVNKLNSILN